MKKLWIFLIIFSPIYSFSQTWEDLDNEGYKYYQQGKYKSALVSYEKALEVAKTQFGDQSVKYALTLHNIGTVNMDGGRYETAKTYFIQAVELRGKILGKEDPDFATSLNNLGIVKTYMGDYLNAEVDLLESARIRKKVLGESDSKYATSLNNLGYLYQMMNRFEDSEKSYLESLDIYGKKGGVKTVSYAQGLNNLGYLYQEMGKSSEAEKFYLEGMELRKELLGIDHQDYAMSLSNLGVLYSELGLYDKSITYLEEAKLIIEKTLGNKHPDYALIINNLAYSYNAISNNTMAEQYYKESIEINKSTVGEKSPYYAMGLDNLAIVYCDTKRYADAIVLYKQAIAVLDAAVGKNNPRFGETLQNLAVAYHKIGKLKEADTCYTKVLALRELIYDPNHKDLASLKNNMGALYWSMNDYTRAKKFFLESLHIISFQIEQQSNFLSEMEMSKFLYTNGFYAKSFYSFCNKYYTNDPTLVLEMNKYYSLVNGKLLKNTNQLKNEIASSNDTLLIAKYNEWLSLKKSINDEMALPSKYRNQYVPDWEAQAALIEKELIRSSSTFKNEIESQEMNLQEVRAQLKPGEAIIEFISFSLYNGRDWTDSMLYSAMIISPEDSLPTYVPLFEESRLEGLFSGDTLRTFANLLYTDAQIRTVEHDISYGDSLYKLIWKPMEPYTKGLTHIYYSPSALLHNIAHDAIPMGDGKLLSDKFQLDRISSPSDIAKNALGNFQLNSIAILGGIQYEMDTTLVKPTNKKVDQNFYASTRSVDNSLSRGGSWSYLPGAKKEVETIADLLKKKAVKVSIFTEYSATEETVKGLDAKNSPSILHFSTHGFFFPATESKQNATNDANAFTVSDNPLFRSGLILAGANYVWKGNRPLEGVEDGILTAYEVSNLYMPNTKLVVMSACETALGDIKRTEGVYGLQRAFKMAGVDYIIVTLWQVLDKETSDFMILFYQNLLEKKSVPTAFKLTQDTMKNKYRDEPYKWAAFVLIN